MSPTLRALIDVLLLEDYSTRLVVVSAALLGATSGLVGSFLLLRKRSLLGDALSHATLPGIGIAFLVMAAAGGSGKHLGGLLLGATISGALGMLLVIAIRRTTRLKDDAAMGIALSVFFGLGVAILRVVQDSPLGSAAGLESFIYGKTASMVRTDFLLIAATAAGVLVVVVLLVKELTLLCFDDGFAASQGWPVLALDLILIGLVTVVTVIGLQAVGLILIIAFLIIPAAAARFWTHRLPRMLLLSALLGALSGWLGAALSAVFSNLPAGALIVLASAAVFMISMAFGSARGVYPRWIEHRRLQRRVGRQHLLRAAYEILERESSGPHVANLPIPVERLKKHRSWSASELLGLLRHARREDHLEPTPGESILLSENGFGEAARVTRNHRLWELYLIRHADVAPSHVDRDADLVEHVLGTDLVRQLEAELAPKAEIPPSPHTI